MEAIRARYASTAAWASHEQAGAIGAPDALLENLARENRRYEERFGFIFIVCATGMSAEEMLALLRQRVSSDREAELNVAAGEQMRITLIRLQRIAP